MVVLMVGTYTENQEQMVILILLVKLVSNMGRQTLLRSQRQLDGEPSNKYQDQIKKHGQTLTIMRIDGVKQHLQILNLLT